MFRLTTVLIIFMIFDSFMSISAVYRWQQRIDGVPASNYFENYLDVSFNDDKMNFLFPHMTEIEDISDKKGNSPIITKQPAPKNQ